MQVNGISSYSNKTDKYKTSYQTLPNSSKYLEISLDLISQNDKKLIDKFTCFNCKNFALNPTSCKYCKILYCFKCVNDFSKNEIEIKNHICLKCGNLRNLQVKGLEPIQLKEISQFKIKCLSSCSGCDVSVNYNDYLIHLENCKYWKGIAECLKCKQIYFTNEIDHKHIKYCEGEYIKCRICLRKIKNDNKNRIIEHEIKCEIEMKIESENMILSNNLFLFDLLLILISLVF